MQVKRAGQMGRLLVTSQAQPAASDIAPDIVQRFVDQRGALAARLASLDAATAARTIMVSPFVGMITYSVLDGWRLMYAHDCRHVQQAHRYTYTYTFDLTFALCPLPFALASHCVSATRNTSTELKPAWLTIGATLLRRRR